MFTSALVRFLSHTNAPCDDRELVCSKRWKGHGALCVDVVQEPDCHHCR